MPLSINEVWRMTLCSGATQQTEPLNLRYIPPCDYCATSRALSLAIISLTLHQVIWLLGLRRLRRGMVGWRIKSFDKLIERRIRKKEAQNDSLPLETPPK